MTRNVGSIDRALRIVVGLALVGIAILTPGAVWAWIGVVPLATGLLGSCPAYSIFGITTCRTRAASH